MNDTVDVSIVIVNWNTRTLLLNVVRSIYETTKRATIEIIVVDNNSQDGSADALAAAYPGITLIRNDDNLGFAKANNIGFRAARGRAFCLVNTDVIALNGAVDSLWEYLVAHPEVGLVGPRQLNGESRTRQNVRRFPNLTNTVGDYLWLKRVGLLPGRALAPETYAYTHAAEVLSGAFLMARKEAVDEVGPLDEDFFFYGEDTDWGKRFHDAGWRIVYHAGAEVIHFGGASTAAYPVKYYLTMERADLMYWHKHHTAGERAIYMVIKVIYHLVSIVGWTGLWLLGRPRREQAALRVKGHAVNTVYLLTRRSLA